MNFVDTTIETDRLLLVPLHEKYAQEIFEEFTSEIATFMFPKPADHVDETKTFIESTLEQRENGTDLVCAITKKETGEFLGCAGLHEIDTNTPELGIWLKKSAHGNKYGREAMIALKQWSDDNLEYKYIKYPAADKNIASRKIPESLGAEVAKEYEQTGLSGNKYYCLEYHIYPK